VAVCAQSTVALPPPDNRRLEEAILQVQFTGPGGIDYINPADDPRKKTN
jgi:hypothetical protein